MKHQFRNDYSSLAHPRILEALTRLGATQQTAYGLDEHSLHAEELIKQRFGCPDAAVHFLCGGTQANLVFLSYALKPYEAIIACSSGHINVHEAGAVEATGHKIFTVPGKDGKVYPEDVEKALALHGDEHVVVLRCVYISNTTETGTLYTSKELQELSACCRKHGLLLFLDGARLGSALTSSYNDLTPEEVASYCDAFYIGGTKNGLPLGEALVLVNPDLQAHFRNFVKSRGAMLAKGYFVGAMFEEAFKDGLYFELAKKTNEVAEYLKEGLAKLGLSCPFSPSNQVFLTLPKDKALKVIAEYGCEKWEDLGDELTIRFVTSFTSEKEDVDDLLSFLSSTIG